MCAGVREDASMRVEIGPWLAKRARGTGQMAVLLSTRSAVNSTLIGARHTKRGDGRHSTFGNAAPVVTTP